MEETVQIYSDDQAVGTAFLTRQGMYWRVQCRCCLPHGGYRVRFCTDRGTTDLGLLCPQGDHFTLTARVSLHDFDPAQLRIFAVQPNTRERIIVLDESRPIDCLPRLREARFCLRDGSACLVLPEKLRTDLIDKSDGKYEN